MIRGGNMNLKIFGKTLLSVYRYLETITNAIENLVDKTTMNSMYLSQQKNLTTFDLSTKLLDLLDKKQKMINLKVICEKCVNQLDDQDKKILYLIYFEGVKSTMISKILNISIRTVFRRKEIALTNFEFLLRKEGYDINYFKENYSSEKWLMDYYRFTSKGFTAKEMKDNEFTYSLIENESEDEQKTYEDSVAKGRIIGSLLKQIKKSFSAVSSVAG